MATFLDLSLFKYFSSVFIFLFVFVIVYAFLHVSKFFKEIEGYRGIYAIISLAIAFFVTATKSVYLVLTTLIPWFTVIIIFLFLVFFVVKMFSGPDDDLIAKVIKDPTVYWVLIVIFIIIFLVSLSSSFGQSLLDKGTGQNTTTVVITNTTTYQTDVTTINNNGDVVTTNTAIDSSNTGNFNKNFLNTIIHPKVLGMLLFMLISFFMVILLARSPNPNNN